jgi:hypothetical protein
MTFALARRLGRRCLAIDVPPAYCAIARELIAKQNE